MSVGDRVYVPKDRTKLSPTYWGPFEVVEIPDVNHVTILNDDGERIIYMMKAIKVWPTAQEC